MPIEYDFEPRDIFDNLDSKYTEHSSLILYNAITEFFSNKNTAEDANYLQKIGIDQNKLALENVIPEFLPKSLLKDKFKYDNIEHTPENNNAILKNKYMLLKEVLQDYRNTLGVFDFAEKRALDKFLAHISSALNKVDFQQLTKNKADIEAKNLESIMPKVEADKKLEHSVISKKPKKAKKTAAFIPELDVLSDTQRETQDKMKIQEENNIGKKAEEARKQKEQEELEVQKQRELAEQAALKQKELESHKDKAAIYKEKVDELDRKIHEAIILNEKFLTLESKLNNNYIYNPTINRFIADYASLSVELGKAEALKKESEESLKKIDELLKKNEPLTDNIEENSNQVQNSIVMLADKIETAHKAAHDLSKMLENSMTKQQNNAETLADQIRNKKSQKENISTKIEELMILKTKIQEIENNLKQNAVISEKTKELQASMQALKNADQKLGEWEEETVNQFRKNSFTPAIKKLSKQIAKETKLNFIAEFFIRITGGDPKASNAERQKDHAFYSFLEELKTINNEKDTFIFQNKMQVFMSKEKNAKFLAEFQKNYEINLSKIYGDIELDGKDIIKDHTTAIGAYKTAQNNYDKLIQKHQDRLNQIKAQDIKLKEQLAPLKDELEKLKKEIEQDESSLTANNEQTQKLTELDDKVKEMSWQKTLKVG